MEIFLTILKTIITLFTIFSLICILLSFMKKYNKSVLLYITQIIFSIIITILMLPYTIISYFIGNNILNPLFLLAIWLIFSLASLFDFFVLRKLNRHPLDF